jgi:hypothetical protein
MKWQAMFRGDYVTAAEMGDARPTLTIAGAKVVRLAGEDGREKDKGVVTFRETDRGWVICKTVAACLGAMFGDETDGWVGKRVTLYATEVAVGREKKLGIRVVGSPDLAKPVEAEIRLPRKRPFKMKLIPTAAGPAPVAHDGEQADENGVLP